MVVQGADGADGQELPWDAGGPATGDQHLHQDISGDTMLLPTPGKCEGVQALLYYSEVGPNGGPTMIVPKDGSVPWETVGEASFERRWDQNNVRRSAESEDAARNPSARDDLYAQERPVRYKPGACFFWRYEVYHRGSAMKPAGLRVMHAFGFRRKDTPWHNGWHTGWAATSSATGAAKGWATYPWIKGSPPWAAS